MFNDRVSYLRVHHTTHSVTQVSHGFHAFHVTNYVNNYFIPYSVQQMSNTISGRLYPYLLIFYKAGFFRMPHFLSFPAKNCLFFGIGEASELPGWRFPDQLVSQSSLIEQRHPLIHPVKQQHGGHQHGVHHNAQKHLAFYVFQAHHEGQQ